MHPPRSLLPPSPILTLFLFFFCSTLALANNTTTPKHPLLLPPTNHFSKELWFDVGGGPGFEIIGDFWYLKLLVGAEFRFKEWKLELQLPLRLSLPNPLISREQPSPMSPRPEDWDHWTDFARFVKSLSFGHKGAPLYFRLGELPSASIGHGSFLYLYSNTVHLNRYHLGIEGQFHTPYGGAELVLNSVLEPRVLAARGYVRPIAFVSPDSFWTRLALGATLALDAYTPFSLKQNVPYAKIPPHDDSFVQEFRGIVGIGLDAEISLIHNANVQLTPYVDLNLLAGHGMGFHAGLLLLGRLASLPLVGRIRLEYRMLGAGYLPQYFHSFYDIHRYQKIFNASSPNGPSLQTQLQGLLTRRDLTHSFYGELMLAWEPWIRLTALFEDSLDPDDRNLTFQLQIPVFRYVQVGFSYSKRGFEGFGEVLQLDNRTMLLAECRIPIWRHFALMFQYQRLWQPYVDIAGGVTYEATHHLSVSFGVQLKPNP